MTRSPRAAEGNRGISVRAGNVTADVMAVGDHATATKTVTAMDSDQLARAVGQLQAAVAALNLPAPARGVIEQDVKDLSAAMASGTPDKPKAKGLLEGLAGKLKMVGVTLHDSVELAEAVAKIGSLLHIPLAFMT